VRSVLLGRIRYTSTARLVATGRGATEPYSPTRSALPELVSNITDGPVEPRDSMFNTTARPAPSGFRVTNDSAPHRHASSASVNRNTTSSAGGAPEVSARAISSRVDTPAPSSLPPNETCTES